MRHLALAACLLLGAAPALAQPVGPVGPIGPSGAPATPPAAPPPASGSAITPARGQASIPLGVTIVVTGVERGADAAVVHLLASFDSRETNSVMLADAPTFLATPEGTRLSLRQPGGNRVMRIQNGQTMEGTLVFPGRLPEGARELRLVFNDGNTAEDTSAPGVTVPIRLDSVP